MSQSVWRTTRRCMTTTTEEQVQIHVRLIRDWINKSSVQSRHSHSNSSLCVRAWVWVFNVTTWPNKTIHSVQFSRKTTLNMFAWNQLLVYAFIVNIYFGVYHYENKTYTWQTHIHTHTHPQKHLPYNRTQRNHFEFIEQINKILFFKSTWSSILPYNYNA